jgi:hypothetical protein
MKLSIRLFVGKTLVGPALTIEVEPSSTINDVKALLEHTANIPFNQQRLIYNGKQLEDNRTLADYNVLDGSTLILSKAV